MATPNPYCAALNIPVPDLARARDVARAHLERNPSSYAFLLVALLEHGAPMTLAEVAARFAEAGVATADDALASLKRCRPARPPVYRDGDLYALDPYDAELDLWAFRLGLRSPRVAGPPASLADPAELQTRIQAEDARRAAHAAELAALRRVLVHTYPIESPVVAVLVDIADRHVETYGADDLDTVRQRLKAYDVIVGLNVRAILRGLGVEHGQLRLAEIGPPQKSMTLPSGRVLRITMDMLIRGSCGIARPLTSTKQLRALVRDNQLARLRQKLEHDARSLFALHQYGRVHGFVRLRWRSVDERLPVAWLHRDEPNLRGLLHEAHKTDADLDVVIGAAPDMADPWAGAIRCFVDEGDRPYDVLLVDVDGWVLDPDDVQWVREAAGVWVDPPRRMGG